MWEASAAERNSSIIDRSIMARCVICIIRDQSNGTESLPSMISGRDQWEQKRRDRKIYFSTAQVHTNVRLGEFQVSADLFLGTLPSSMHDRMWEDHGSTTRAASFDVHPTLEVKVGPLGSASSVLVSVALFSHRWLSRSEAKTRQLIITHSCEKTRSVSLLGMLHSLFQVPRAAVPLTSACFRQVPSSVQYHYSHLITKNMSASVQDQLVP